MNEELILSKFEDLRKDSPRVIFGYTYYHRDKDVNYIAAQNMRLEAVQLKDGKVLYTKAAPILHSGRGLNSVRFCDKGLVFITTGPRTNIVLKEEYLKDDEEAAPATHLGTEEVTCESNIEIIYKVVNLLTSKPFSGLSMRLPDFFRMTKNPSRMRLNINKDLLDHLGLDNTAGSTVIKQKFLDNLDTIAGRTDKGYVVPMEWINAGGMLTVDGRDLGKGKPKITYIRTPEFFSQYVKTHNWEIECL